MLGTETAKSNKPTLSYETNASSLPPVQGLLALMSDPRNKIRQIDTFLYHHSLSMILPIQGAQILTYKYRKYSLTNKKPKSHSTTGIFHFSFAPLFGEKNHTTGKREFGTKKDKGLTLVFIVCVLYKQTSLVNGHFPKHCEAQI